MDTGFFLLQAAEKTPQSIINQADISHTQAAAIKSEAFVSRKNRSDSILQGQMRLQISMQIVMIN